MSKLRRRRVLLAKVEVTYNTDPTPTGAANAIQVEELTWLPEGLRMVERPAIRSSLGALQHVYGESLLRVTVSAEVKGSGVAGTAPELGALFLGCGMAETVVGGTSVTYDPASATQKSLTFYIYEEVTLIKITGARGTFELSGEVGGRLMAAFTFTGHFSGPTDVALASPTYDSTVPPILVNGNFTIGAFGAIIQALSVDMGLTIETPSDLNATDGYGEVLVTDRDVNGSFNPEQTLVATKDFMAIFKAGTLEAIDTGVIGATAGNKFQITLPKTYYRNLSPADREGVLVYDLPFGAAENTGDDEVALAFT